MQREARQRREASARDYYDNYAEYNRTLRAWFVIFGVGGPATLLAREGLAERLAAAGELGLVAALFVLGAAAQVLIALLNKTASWFAYHGELSKPFRRTRRYRAMTWVNNQFWLDVAMDMVSIAAFATAIWRLFSVLGG
jgi:hypothetical protein